MAGKLKIRNGDSVEEIVVADPLFEDGQEFFLTRDLLEPAWDGEAIIFQPLPARRKYKVRSLVSGLGLCAAALTIGLLVFDVHGAQEVVRYFVSVLQAGATNHVTASSGTDAASSWSRAESIMLSGPVPAPIVQSVGVSIAYQRRATNPAQLRERPAACPGTPTGAVLNCSLRLGSAIRICH